MEAKDADPHTIKNSLTIVPWYPLEIRSRIPQWIQKSPYMLKSFINCCRTIHIVVSLCLQTSIYGLKIMFIICSRLGLRMQNPGINRAYDIFAGKKILV